MHVFTVNERTALALACSCGASAGRLEPSWRVAETVREWHARHAGPACGPRWANHLTLASSAA
ncbi:MAG: hypothetical protein VW450_02150 [Chloroflexota bacterium]